jgi:hypothetical protein
LTDKPVIQEDGSEVAMKNSLFKRNHAGKYFEYKYYMNLSQTDCRMSLEAFSATGRTRRMLLQYSISAFEVESAELQDEYRFAEQLSRSTGADERQSKCLDTSPDPITPRSLRFGNSDDHTSAPNTRSLRTKESHCRSIVDFAFGTLTEDNICQQSRPNGLLNSALLNNTGPLAEKSKNSLHKDSFPSINSVLDSQPDPLDLATATRAMKVALAVKTGIQDGLHELDKSLSVTQGTPIQKRAKGKDSTHGYSGGFSGVMPSSDSLTPRRRVTDFASATAESDDSDYQV